MGHGGGSWAMVGWWLLALVTVIGALSTAIALGHRSRRPAATTGPPGEASGPDHRTHARKLLDDRYAAGTIDSDEYRERVITLEQNG